MSDSVHEKGCGRGREKDVVTVVLSSPLHRDKATGWGGGRWGIMRVQLVHHTKNVRSSVRIARGRESGPE